MYAMLMYFNVYLTICHVNLMYFNVFPYLMNSSLIQTAEQQRQNISIRPTSLQPISQRALTPPGTRYVVRANPSHVYIYIHIWNIRNQNTQNTYFKTKQTQINKQRRKEHTTHKT